MSPQAVVSLVALVAVLLMMLAEMQLSRHNERVLRSRGAVEPSADVYRTMAWAYPALFVVMAVEGAVFGPAPGPATLAGAALLGAAKALKFWAIASLGSRWTFRVLVPPDGELVTGGPYAFLRHPNYVAVIGELASMGLLVGARVSGPVALLLFGVLIRQRIRVEETALRHPPCS
jgi:methyltransferase